MPNADTDHLTDGQLAEQAGHAIRLLNHRTRPATTDLTNPAQTAEIIAALANMADMLPQLLSQIAHWLQHEHHGGRLRVDDLAPLLDTAQTVHAVTDSLHDGINCVQHAAANLHTAHQHAAHLARQPGPEFMQISGAKSLDETHQVLIRRNDTTGELAYYRCYAPRLVPLTTLVAVAGQRWRIEESFQAAKGLVGLDQHQVRRWTSWHRWTTLAMLAHAFLAVATAGERDHTPTPTGLIQLTLAEFRRLFAALLLATAHTVETLLTWSRWRRRHQARARDCHYKRRQQQ